MATSVTSLTVEAVVRPINGLPFGAQRWDLGVPSHWLTFGWNQEDVTAGNATDDQFLSIICGLPQNYAYLLIDCSFRLQGAVGQPLLWDGETSSSLTDNAGGTDYQSNQLFLASPQVINDGSQLVAPQRNYYLQERVPQTLLIPFRNQGGTLSIALSNSALNGVACKTTGFASLLAFNIEQAYNYVVNTPEFSRG